MAQKEITIKVLPGGDCLFLYDDIMVGQDGESKLMPGGNMDVTRASHVLYNPESKRWFIHLIVSRESDGSTKARLVGNAEGYAKRSHAIDAEIALLNDMLEKGTVNPNDHLDWETA